MGLRGRLLAAFAYVLLLVIVALVVPLALNLISRAEAEAEAHAQSQAHLIAAAIAGNMQDRAELRRVARQAAGDLGGRVIVVGSRARVFADSAGRGLEGRSYRSRPEIAEALAERRPVQLRRQSRSLDQELLVTAVPVLVGGKATGVVRVTQSFEAIERSGRRDALALVGFGAVALALGLGAAWLVAGSLARPLRNLAGTARSVADGNLEARAAREGAREQRELADAFNEMTGRLGGVLEAQREFVANASHQLRTPLTGLRLRLEAAALKAGNTELERELAAAEREAERLSRLLNGLLTLAREGGDPGPGRPVELDLLAEEAAERWREPARRSGHELVLAGDGDAVAEASRDDLLMALDNLIENALHYSPAGTAVTVEWSQNREWASLAVADEGPGIAPAERARVFQRFYRGASAASQPGTGLGLAIVDSVARRWGGRTQIEERRPRGTRIELVLPRAPGFDEA
ncbi:MAG: HAMP domain-containing histidine kinase [Thermoleophilia bacterium]|nr:HAMP domain-containing histidine kinase [Thermoleophilia bacterium]